MKYSKSYYPDKTNGLMNEDGSLNIIEKDGKKYAGKVYCEAYMGEEDLFGKEASELQDIYRKGEFLFGNVNYVDDYEGFSSKPEEQNGHYVVVRGLTCLEDVDLYAKMGYGKEVKLDSDGLIVFITHEQQAPIHIYAKDEEGEIVAEDVVKLAVFFE